MATEIVIPRLGWSMEEGTFLGWRKNDGDLVQPGEPLFELEGEKATQEIESLDEGILRLLPKGPQPGDVLKVGAVLGYLLAPGEAIPSPKITGPATVAAPSARKLALEIGFEVEAAPGPRRTATAAPITPTPVAAVTPSREVPRPHSSPRARRVAKELGVEWKMLTGTGANGRIREADVRAGVRASTPKETGSRQAPTSRRKVIAQRMVATREQVVPVTLTTRADAGNLVSLREQFRSRGPNATVPSYQEIITKLTAEVLKQHLPLAGRWEDDEIVLPSPDELHLGMAVDTPDGLLVPVLRNVGRVSLVEVERESRRLIERARAGKLTASEMQGGIFTITNLGAFGIDVFTPVIRSPEAAILGLGAIRREPVVLEDGTIAARSQITLNLTFDHRIVDGAPAARFLQTLAEAVGNPSAWLIGG